MKVGKETNFDSITMSSEDKNILNKIKDFMEGRLEFESNEDISYNWVMQDENINTINKPIVCSLEDLKNQINSRDLICELKVRNL